MKKFLLIIISMLTISMASSQNMGMMQTDSLRHELLIAKHDTSRALIMANLAEGYRGTKPDSAMLYAQQALRLSRQINFPLGEVRALLGISVVLRELGNWPRALEMGFKALKIADENNMTREEGFCLVRIANVYAASKNYRDALNYYEKADKKLEGSNDHFLVGASYYLAADIYDRINKPDSALYKAELAYSDLLKMKNEILWPGLLRLFGNIQAGKGNKELALQYYHESVGNALKLNDHRNASAVYADMATFFIKNGNTDSAIHYGKMALQYAELLSYKGAVMRAANLLADIYESTDPKESLRYYKMGNAAKDSLYSAEKVQELQTMTFEEEERKKELVAANVAYQNRVKQYALLAGLAIFLLIALILYRNNRHKQKTNKVLEGTLADLKATHADLKATQSQLIQSEKMASLGELTAGIAHEIQNPLNFVNNFSDVNKELILEMNEEIQKGNYEEVKAIAKDVTENEEKINHHGKRADAIVKGMLQHSRSSSGVKEPTDINALADEYLRLAYHGLRAKDKSFNATMKTDFDESIGDINIIPQDIGRVILNLITNAFYAASPPTPQGGISDPAKNNNPTVWVKTKKMGDKVLISVRDNGPGIPKKILDKIFQPFFTTKPTGQGTGLGLSLSYDIIKAHGGEMKVETKEREFTEFILVLSV